VGERGVIEGFSDDVLALKLLEMGCLPGTEVVVTTTAPFGDPLCIRVAGYALALRRAEARTILLKPDSPTRPQAAAARRPVEHE
jgi:ferrous iron transport protein A